MKSHRGDVVIEPGSLSTRINDEQMIQSQIRAGGVHGSMDSGAFRGLHFKANSFTLMQDKQVQLGRGMGRPEVDLRQRVDADQLLDGKAFP